MIFELPLGIVLYLGLFLSLLGGYWIYLAFKKGDTGENIYGKPDTNFLFWDISSKKYLYKTELNNIEYTGVKKEIWNKADELFKEIEDIHGNTYSSELKGNLLNVLETMLDNTSNQKLSQISSNLDIEISTYNSIINIIIKDFQKNSILHPIGKLQYYNLILFYSLEKLKDNGSENEQSIITKLESIDIDGGLIDMVKLRKSFLDE